MSELTKISIEYINTTNIEKRKRMGQYFTPKSIRDILMNLLPKTKSPIVLEPSCGTGEFIKSIQEYFKSPVIHAIELDKNLYNLTKKNYKDISIFNCDTLFYTTDIKYDFIIGNPPYFEFKMNEKIKESYEEIINGRANIYSFFIKKGIDLLKDNGYLAYIVPTSMNSGAYFAELRNYIISNTNIENIILFNEHEFKDAQQAVMILVLKKTKNNGQFIFSKDNINIFSKDYKELDEIFKGKKSLKEIGLEVKTGNIVWNQNKDKLSHNKKDKTTLIWAHNIGQDGNIDLHNDEKPQYININNFTNEAIVVNRIIGLGNGAKIKAAIMKKGRWAAENHVNVISKTPKSKGIILSSICDQLRSENALDVVKKIIGNTQLSKSELENLIPIDPKKIKRRGRRKKEK